MSRLRVALAVVGLLMASATVAPSVRAGGGPGGGEAVYFPGPVAITNTDVLAFSVPPGNWAIMAKGTVRHTSAMSQGVDCQLTAEFDYDLVKASNGDQRREIALAVVHPFPTGGYVVLHCETAPGATAEIADVRVFAYSVGQLTNRELPSGYSSTVGSGSPRTIAGFRNGPVAIRVGSLGSVASLPLPAGRWWVFAKLYTTGLSAATTTECRLEIGSSSAGWLSHRAMDAMGAPATPDTEASVLWMEQARRLTSPGSARVRCEAASAATAHFVKILAVRAGKLSIGRLGETYTTSGTGTPVVRLGMKAGPVSIATGSSWTSLGSLRLPAGNWLFFAAASVGNESGSKAALLGCRLNVAEDTDVLTGLDLTATRRHRRSPVILAAGRHMPIPFTYRLECRASGAPLRAYDIRIAAISMSWYSFQIIVP